MVFLNKWVSLTVSFAFRRYSRRVVYEEIGFHFHGSQAKELFAARAELLESYVANRILSPVQAQYAAAEARALRLAIDQIGSEYVRISVASLVQLQGSWVQIPPTAEAIAVSEASERDQKA